MAEKGGFGTSCPRIYEQRAVRDTTLGRFADTGQVFLEMQISEAEFRAAKDQYTVVAQLACWTGRQVHDRKPGAHPRRVDYASGGAIRLHRFADTITLNLSVRETADHRPARSQVTRVENARDP
jgi:hypothetical protein